MRVREQDCTVSDGRITPSKHLLGLWEGCPSAHRLSAVKLRKNYFRLSVRGRAILALPLREPILSGPRSCLQGFVWI
jgi:hypothetical protein